MNTLDGIKQLVHNCYWEKDINCANTTLECLSTLFNIQIAEQLYKAAIGLHGAGGYRAQCGLVEGALMFTGLYADQKGKTKEDAIEICYQLAQRFEEQFGSLQCFYLRPNGFTDNDPPHACEELTANAISFIYAFLNDALVGSH